MKEEFDLAILGGGPGGYQAALHAQARGLRCVLIERADVGGICLNWGCIPTKTLLAAAKFYDRTSKSDALGINLPSRSFQWSQVIKRKNAVVSGLRSGMEKQLVTKGIKLVKGVGSLKGPRVIGVTTQEAEEEICAKSVIIATGSRPKPFPGIAFDSKLFLSSDDILKLSAVPEKLVIIGGGAIGVEYASLFHAFGTKVSIVEMMERLLPSEDSDLGKRIEMSFKRRGIEVHAGAKVSGVTKSGSDVTVKLEKGKVLQGDKLLIAIGRDRNTSGLGLEQSGVALNGDAIEVDGYLETKAQHVFAIGDVTRLPQLAHVASFGGTLVVDNLLKPNKRQVFPAHAIPNCIFSDPLIASVGLTRAVAEKQGIRVREARLLLSSQGKAHVEGELEGFVKLVINENTKTVIGGHVMGGEASEMIGVIALAASECITVDRLANTIFPHPTYHEIIGDAARVLAIES